MSAFDPEEYWEQRLGAHFDLQGVGYLGLGESYNKWLYRIRRRVFLRVVRSLDISLSSADVIDIGSGTGFYIERWKELRVRTITGTDITDVAIRKLRETFPHDRFYRLDIGGDLLEHQGAGRYDVASAFDVLFHIVDDDRYRRAIRNIHTLLRNGGWFLFSENFLHGETVRTPYQVSRSLEEIEGTVQEAGFRILKRVPMFVMMNFPIDAERGLGTRLWTAMKSRVQRRERLGLAVGGLLYPMERVLTRWKKESPTTEIMLCRKKG